jgi:hypothetical protein
MHFLTSAYHLTISLSVLSLLAVTMLLWAMFGGRSFYPTVLSMLLCFLSAYVVALNCMLEV